MLLTGVAQAFADTVSYQFTSRNWTAIDNGVAANWHCIQSGVKDGNTSYVKIEGGCIASANSTVSFDNISLVKVYYATTTNGKGRLSVFCVNDSLASLKFGSIIGDSLDVQGPAAKDTDRYVVFKPSSLCSGFIQLYASCSVNSIYIRSVDIEYSSNSPVLRNNVSALDFGSVETNKSKELTFKLSGRNLKSDAVLSVEGEGFSVDPAHVSPNEGEIAETDVKVTYSPTSVGTHHAKLTISSDGATSKVISLTGTAIAPTVYHTVTWLVNGEIYKEGNPTLDVAEGKKVTSLPSTPQAIEDKEFVGWTDSNISGSKNEKPSVLFVDTASAPVVKADAVYYAVFAKKTGNEVTYTKLNSNKFKKDAEYVIGAEDTNGQVHYFYMYARVDANVNWGKMSNDVMTNSPIEFQLSGTSDKFEAKDTNENYLQAVEGGFQMSSTSVNISIGSDGFLHSARRDVKVTLRFSPTNGLRWYPNGQGASFNAAYFYEISGGVTYSGYCTSVPRTVSFKAIDSDGTRYATFSSTRDVVFVGEDLEVAGLKVENSLISPIHVKPASYEVTDVSVGENGVVKGCYVPAKTGVLLKSKSATASYYYAKSAHEDILSGNMLKPAPVGGGVFTAETGYWYYKLAYNNYSTKKGLGFYWGDEDGGAFKVKDGLAYLAVPSADAHNAKGFRFDGVTDGIDGVEVDRNKSHDLYNLIGQRVVGRAAPGLYVVNGKKVLIRK